MDCTDSERAVEFDDADDGTVHMLNSSGRWQTFNVDRAFKSQQSQTDVCCDIAVGSIQQYCAITIF